MRFFVVGVAVALLVLAAVAALVGHGPVSIACVVLLGLAVCLAACDLLQRRHSILRNYPLAGHLRFLAEAIRPELQQYFIERNFDGRPFDRDIRTAIYEYAKDEKEEKAYGTERDVTAVGYEWLLQTAAAIDPPKDQPRVRVGGPDCSKPYDMALLNVSAMSFGALSGDALRALNQGAAKGGFAHDTGEGGLNPEEVSLPPKVEPGEAWGFAVAKLKEVLTSREG